MASSGGGEFLVAGREASRRVAGYALRVARHRDGLRVAKHRDGFVSLPTSLYVFLVSDFWFLISELGKNGAAGKIGFGGTARKSAVQ